MMDAFSLKNKTIVVTGSTGVLGASFIRAIAQAGGQLVLLGRNMEVAEARAHAICEAGGKAIAIRADVLKEDELSKACSQATSVYGSIDGLVNAAGGNLPGAVVDPSADLFSLDIDALKKVHELNLIGTILPTQVFGKSIAATGSGSIVNISSVSASRALTRVLGYSLAKAGVEAYTRWMAVELAHRYRDAIRINAMVPGFFLTEQNKQLLTTESGAYTPRAQKIIEQTPFGRLGAPVELEGGLIWLLSDASKFVSGTTISIDGAFSAFSGV
jgi:NAD(P)-dependent dehydrogenase (short-subunit alcohol dehydrogenase family)